MAKVFEIREEECELPIKRGERLPDVISAQEIMDRYLSLADHAPDIIERHDTIEAARKALKMYEKKATSNYYSWNGSRFFKVDVYFIEENDYDENGDWANGGDVWNYVAAPVTVNY